MADRRERLVCVAIAVLLLQLAAYANAADLEILPLGEKQTKRVDSSILLTCKPKGTDPTLFTDMQWLDPRSRVIESRNNGQSSPSMYTEKHQDGSLSLFFNSLKEEQEGQYTCLGSYARSPPINKSVTIETNIGITWDNAPENQYPILGKDFAVQCQVRARPPPSVDWLYNGDLIKTNDHYAINTYSLLIKNVQESDDGIYTCRASVQTTGELRTRDIRVEVHIPPKMAEKDRPPVDIIEGENANIECTASGKPPPRYSWIKSLTQKNLSLADRFGVDPIKGILTITNVNREDEGEYQCIAMNGAGQDSSTIRVKVIVKPKIMEFTNVTAVQDNNTIIMCKAFGRPAPSVIFRKLTTDKQYVSGTQAQDDRISMGNKKDEVTGETIGTLEINKVLLNDDGLYECRAKNIGGFAYKNGHLTVESPPSFRNMKNETIWSWEQRPVNLTCIAESIPNATIRWTWLGQNAEPTESGNFKVFNNGPTSILMVIPYDNRYYTTYTCNAANKHGTRTHQLELRQATKPAAIENAKMAEISATTIRFDLTPPQTKDLPITTINVQYKENNQLWQNAKNVTWSLNSLYVLEHLEPQTTYNFRFAARSLVGLGTYGADIVETTPGRMAPFAPRIITTLNMEYEVSKFNNQYALSWVTPADNGVPIDMYRIKYCQVKRIAGDWEVLDHTCLELRTKNKTSQYIKDLNPDTFYTVELQAHNAMGYSKPGFAKFRTVRESTGITVDYTVESAAGDTCKIAVAAITAAVMLSLTI